MAKINLRPWRDELRAQRQQEYLMVLALVFVAAAAIWYGARTFVTDEVQYQGQRNGYLQKQIAGLEDKINEIQRLREQRSQLLERMKLIQDLQGNRPVIVRTFDEMARVIPDGVYFESVKIAGKSFTIQGRSESNKQVAQLMRNFDESPWFANPNLLGVKANKNSYNSFDILVAQSEPVVKEAE